MTRPLAIAAVALVAIIGAGTSMAALPGHLAARMQLEPGRYDAGQVLALHGAVLNQRLGVLSDVTGRGDDFDRLVGMATREGHGTLQSVALYGR